MRHCLWGEKCHIIFNIIITFVHVKKSAQKAHEKRSSPKMLGECVCGNFACGRLQSVGSRKYVELLAFHQYNNYCYYYDYYVVVLLFFHTSLWQCVNVYEIIFLWATIATSSSKPPPGPGHNYYGYGNLSVDITSAGRLRCCQYITERRCECSFGGAECKTLS